MPEDVVATTDATPSVPVDQGGSPPPAASTPNPLEERLSQLEARLSSSSEELAKRDSLIQHYQQALGAQRSQTPAATQDDISSKFDAETIRFVNTQAEKISRDLITKEVSKLTMQAQAQQRLGGDPELVKTAQTVYQEYKQNPYFQNQSEEILMALAAGEAEARVSKSRLEAQRKDYQRLQAEQARQSQASSATLPSTQNRPPQFDASDPDRDIKEWMSDPQNQLVARKFIRATAGRDIDPTSAEKVRWFGKETPANEIYKQTAIRAVRTGVGLSERMRGAMTGGA